MQKKILKTTNLFIVTMFILLGSNVVAHAGASQSYASGGSSQGGGSFGGGGFGGSSGGGTSGTR